MVTQQDYQDWLRLREESTDEWGEKLCYCGHTTHCECADPDYTLFEESWERGMIILNDPSNGWKIMDDE